METALSIGGESNSEAVHDELTLGGILRALSTCSAKSAQVERPQAAGALATAGARRPVSMLAVWTTVYP
jgi:hypothetical protein